MSYEEIVRHAHTYGLVLLAVVFTISVIYALWPGNKERFKQAARTPLNDEADDV
ncbi:MAG: cbb3-type cytochrome c oxidase subunit 3 [Hyphomonadaceae bacterium]|nr:cbb3-type cytochrome c oxidase subunit 3 [Hyphomonadaceae bacterium]